MWRTFVILLALPPGKALAYKPVPPERHDVFSDNREFVLDVNPDTDRLTVYEAGKRDQPLWSFGREIWQEKHFLSNDGNVVAIVTWRFVQVDTLDKGVCIEFWNRTGKFREYTFAEICPNPSRYYFEPGPIGSFWRKWYSEVKARDETLRVRTTGEFEYEFSLQDGKILSTTRIGLPPWAWWLLLGCGAGMVVAVVVIWKRRAGNVERR